MNTITNEIIALYKEYAKAYDADPMSIEADKTFENLSKKVEKQFDSDLHDFVMDILCQTTKDQKIKVEQNLSELQEKFSHHLR